MGADQERDEEEGQVAGHVRRLRIQAQCHLADWLDQPLVAITRPVCRKLHTGIGENHGTYMANGVMRVLRLIWRRVRRQHPGMPEPPTMNVDFFAEHGRTAVITDWPSWWEGVQQIANPVRRDFYIWLAFSGCRAGESMSMQVANIDLENGMARYPVTKTKAFEMPLSDYMIALLHNRIADNAEEFGANCRWIFPSVTSATGHLQEERLTAAEPKLFAEKWSPHTLRHSWITLADQRAKIPDSHARALVNHKPKRGKHGDAHQGYVHVHIDDLRISQQRMTDYLLALIEPKPGKGNKHGDDVVKFQQRVRVIAESIRALKFSLRIRDAMAY